MTTRSVVADGDERVNGLTREVGDDVFATMLIVASCSTAAVSYTLLRAAVLT